MPYDFIVSIHGRFGQRFVFRGNVILPVLALLDRTRCCEYWGDPEREPQKGSPVNIRCEHFR
jgi:hypothetical protein